MAESRKAKLEGTPVIPDKLYFRIGEVARLLALEPHTLRFWETEFPQLRVNKGGTGQRLYRRRDVETALRIKQLLYRDGYTIPGARQALQTEARRTDPKLPFVAPGTDETAQSRLQRMRSELKEISGILSRPTATDRKLSLMAKSKSPARKADGLHLAQAPHAAPIAPEGKELLFGGSLTESE